jgi:hypothetical protein
MDELSDIEARREANAENLRRAFGPPVGGEPPAFAALLERLAAKGKAPGPMRRPGHAPDQSPGRALGAVVLAGGTMRDVTRGVTGAAWSRPLAET